MHGALSNIERLDACYFPLLQLEQRTLRGPNLQNPKIVSLLTSLRRILEDYVLKPQRVLDELHRFLFLLSKTRDNIVEILKHRTYDAQLAAQEERLS